MGIRGFGCRVERMVEGAFARAFKSGLRPVELGRRLGDDVSDAQVLERHRGEDAGLGRAADGDDGEAHVRARQHGDGCERDRAAAFGIVFGATSATSGSAGLLSAAGVREAAIGIAACATLLLWFLWRAATVRRLALRDAGGVRQRPARRAAIGRAGMATGMLAVGVVVAIALTPMLTNR